jgi:glutamine synthetase
MKFSSALALVLTGYVSAFSPMVGKARPQTGLQMAGSVMKSVTGRSQLDPAVVDRFNALPFPADKILAEYVWCDAEGNTRSKTRTLPSAKVCL